MEINVYRPGFRRFGQDGVAKRQFQCAPLPLKLEPEHLIRILVVGPVVNPVFLKIDSTSAGKAHGNTGRLIGLESGPDLTGLTIVLFDPWFVKINLK